MSGLETTPLSANATLGTTRRTCCLGLLAALGVRAGPALSTNSTPTGPEGTCDDRFQIWVSRRNEREASALFDDPLPRVIRASWVRLNGTSRERAEIKIATQSVNMKGTVAFTSQPTKLWYDITCNGSWEFLSGAVALSTLKTPRRLALKRHDNQWLVDDVYRPDLEACRDLDIMGTPSTNTLPIRRLPWITGESRELQVAFVDLPTCKVAAAMQRYTRLTNDRSGHRRFKYENVASGFSAELLVDDDGLVLSYPPIWKRTPTSISMEFNPL